MKPSLPDIYLNIGYVFFLLTHSNRFEKQYPLRSAVSSSFLPFTQYNISELSKKGLNDIDQSSRGSSLGK